MCCDSIKQDFNDYQPTRDVVEKLSEAYYSGEKLKNGGRPLSQYNNQIQSEIFKKVEDQLIKGRYILGDVMNKGGDAVAVYLKSIKTGNSCNVLVISHIRTKEFDNIIKIFEIVKEAGYTFRRKNAALFEIYSGLSDGETTQLLFSINQRFNTISPDTIKNEKHAKKMLEIIKFMADNFILHNDSNNIGNWMICNGDIKIIDFNFSLIIDIQDDIKSGGDLEILPFVSYWDIIDENGIDYDELLENIYKESLDKDGTINESKIQNMIYTFGILDLYNGGKPTESIGYLNKKFAEELVDIVTKLDEKNNFRKFLEVIINNEQAFTRVKPLLIKSIKKVTTKKTKSIKKSKYKIGDQLQAKWLYENGNSEWYNAKITEVNGNEQPYSYNVIFEGDETLNNVPLEHLRQSTKKASREEALREEALREKKEKAVLRRRQRVLNMIGLPKF